jgi:serine/threonine protein kinase
MDSLEVATNPLEEPSSEVEQEDVLVGRVLDGRYRMIRRLGHGGMGAVYEAEHLKLETKVAIKVLQSSLSSSDKYRKRFLREARAASAIESEHIVRSSDFGATDDGLLYFAMELMEGEDLEQYLQRCSKLEWPQLEPLLFQITHALEAAHKRGVIHRDIKPSNCFLCASEQWPPLLKVLDFGIAKINAAVADGESPVATLETLTATNELFGTIAYMAPELIEGHPADARSDIYALGVLVFRVLTGKLPFTSPNMYKVLQLHVSAPVPSMRTLVPEIPAAVESVVFRAMAKRPEHRYQSIVELGAAFRAASRGVIEPSAVGLFGHTQAVHRAGSGFERSKPDDGLSSGDLAAAPTVAQAHAVAHRVDDPGSLASARIRAPRFSPLAMLGIVLAVAGGTAAIVYSLVDASRTDPSGAPALVEASVAPPTTPPVATADADTKASMGNAETPISESKPLAGEPPVEAPSTEPSSEASKSGSTARKAKTKAPTSERSIHELAGQQCPAAVGGHFIIEGLLGGDGKYIKPTVTGEPKAARPCIETFIRARSFGKGRSMKTHTEPLHPR